MAISFVYLTVVTRKHSSKRQRRPAVSFMAMPNITDVVTMNSHLEKFLKLPVINKHDFPYILNEEARCQENNVEILFIVPSAPQNILRRKSVRTSSLYRFVKNPKNKAALMFFIGVQLQNSTTEDNRIQYLIEVESLNYQDIVQQNFTDIYHHVRYKHVSMLQWASKFCSNASYVIRNDDDVTIDQDRVIKRLRILGSRYDNFIVGDVSSARLVVHDKASKFSKYYVSREEYPGDYFPPFARGGLLGYPLQTVRLLYEAALRLKPLWLDDVFITAFCRKRINATLLADSEFIFLH